MAFTETAFACLAPLLLLMGWFVPDPYRKWAKALLAVVSLTLILNSIFLVRQLIAMAKWAEEMARIAGISLKDMPPFQPDVFFFRLMGMVFLPWLLLVRSLRNTPWLPLVLLVIIYAGGTGSWNTSGLLLKCLWLFSLLCGLYALLWLLRDLSFQRRKKNKRGA